MHGQKHGKWNIFSYVRSENVYIRLVLWSVREVALIADSFTKIRLTRCNASDAIFTIN